jgi:hypothetical protein
VVGEVPCESCAGSRTLERHDELVARPCSIALPPNWALTVGVESIALRAEEMMGDMSTNRHVSPDGLWEWDGKSWQPTALQRRPFTDDAVGDRAPHADPKAAKRAAKAAAKAEAAAAKESARQEARARAEEEQFNATPAGRARVAFARGDLIFQYSIDVMNQSPRLVGGRPARLDMSDPSAVLNAVAREGWELVNGSFVFVETKATQHGIGHAVGMTSEVKMTGTTFGYYLFKRSPSLRTSGPS